MSYLELESSTISLHIHTSRDALADVDDVHTAMGCLVEQSHDPRGMWGIARTISSHHNTSEGWGFQDVANDGILNAWEETEDDDVWIQFHVWHHRLAIVWRQDMMRMEREVDTYITEMRMVEGIEGMESFGIDLRGTVTAQQLTIEEDADLWYQRMTFQIFHGGYLDGSHHVLLAVGTQFADRQLATGENDRLGQVFEHER